MRGIWKIAAVIGVVALVLAATGGSAVAFSPPPEPTSYWGVVTPSKAPFATAPAWEYNDGRWTRRIRRQGRRVWVVPFVGAPEWRWTWTRNRGWRAMRAQHLMRGDREVFGQYLEQPMVCEPPAQCERPIANATLWAYDLAHDDGVPDAVMTTNRRGYFHARLTPEHSFRLDLGATLHGPVAVPANGYAFIRPMLTDARGSMLGMPLLAGRVLGHDCGTPGDIRGGATLTLVDVEDRDAEPIAVPTTAAGFFGTRAVREGHRYQVTVDGKPTSQVQVTAARDGDTAYLDTHYTYGDCGLIT